MRKRFPHPVWLCALALLGLTGCMPDLDPQDRQATLVIAKAFAPLSLDPAVYATGNDYPVHELVYEQLLSIDLEAADGVGPELARSWAFSDGGRAITLELEEGHTFESGAPVDAEAVRYSLMRVKQVGRWSSGYTEWLDDVEVLAPYRVRLHLKRPYRPALQLLAHSATSIVDPSAVQANEGDDFGIGYLSANSAGSGPYRLLEKTVDGTVILIPNPQAPPPKTFTRIEFRPIPDEGVRRLLLERGDIDFTDIVPSAFLQRYRAIEGVDAITGAGGSSLSYLTLNTRNGPFSDIRLRQAAHAAIDYHGLRTLVLKGNAIQLPGYLTPYAAGYDDRESPPGRDLEEASRLLTEAGYKGEPVEFITSQIGPVGEFIQSNLKEAGFNVQIVRRDLGSIDSLKRKGDFDLIYEGWLTDSPDPSSMLEALFASRNIETGLNASGYRDPETDRLINALLSEAEPERRRRLQRQIDQRLRQKRPVVMLFSALPIAAYRDDIEGVSINPVKPYFHPFHEMTRTMDTDRP